jgi:pyruvate dehydrogenase E2 component (dihydrolipoamide acetyltransferase)
MARIDVIMPQMGESIAEGTIAKWLKKLGDTVKRDEPIFEISTDKVDAEIPSPDAGVLAEILVEEGATVAVQTVVARIETDAGAAVEPPSGKGGGEGRATAADSTEPIERSEKRKTPEKTPERKEAPKSEGPAPRAEPPPAPPAPPATAANGPETAEERLRRKSTPLVRRMVAEHGLDLAAIPGSGMAGRVTRQDVLDYLEKAPESAPGPAPREAATAAGPAGVRVIPGPVVEPWEGDRVEPWSRIRKLTADHMIMSRRVSAHVHSIIEVDYTRVAAARARDKTGYRERGVNLTFLAFIAKAVADNLRKHPVLNAAVLNESTIFRREINLGIAVALDWGLIVPVIRRADELSLIGMARAIQDLADRARSKRLQPEEVQKGTFSITNPGVFGTRVGLPVLNQPQSAILAVGGIGRQPVVVEAADGSETIGIRTRGLLALGFDHRIVDGADADRFLADVRATLEQWSDTNS